MKNDSSMASTSSTFRNLVTHPFRSLLIVYLINALACGNAWALPDFAQATTPAGFGSFSYVHNGNTLTITNTPNTVINWGGSGFSINQNETVTFVQSSAGSRVLNRDMGNSQSFVRGLLQSTVGAGGPIGGSVYLINPNGIVFGPNGRVNVGNFVASTVDMTNDNFRDGINKFTIAPPANTNNIVNNGLIETPANGTIFLVSPQVTNGSGGTIRSGNLVQSPDGSIVLAAGQTVDLGTVSNPDIRITLSAPTDQAVNLGSVIANAGKIGIYGVLVRQSGVVNADSAVAGQNGSIIFKSVDATQNNIVTLGTTTVNSNSQTTARTVDGGSQIQILGSQVALLNNASIDASGQTSNATNSSGGTIFIGGGLGGNNPNIPNSTATYIGGNARITSNGFGSGAGGYVAVWSNDATRYYGTITALGGATGSGGKAEIGSGNYLLFRGAANLLGDLDATPASLFLTGDNIHVNGTSTNGSAGTANFSIPAAGTPSIIHTPSLVNALSNANVTIKTSQPTNPEGTITFDSATALAWATPNRLTLDAGANIDIGSAITGTSGTLLMQSANGRIAQTSNGVISVANLNANAPNGSVVLALNNNQVDQLSGSALSEFTFFGGNGFNIDAGGISTSNAGLVGLSSGGNITQTGAISTGSLGVGSTGGSITLLANNNISNVVAARTNGGAFAFSNLGSFKIGDVSSPISPVSINSINTGSGAISLISGGSIETIGTSTITGSNLMIQARSGVGSQAAPLNTAVGILSIDNNSGDIAVSNETANNQLTVAGINQTVGGNIFITNPGTLTVAGPIITPDGDIGLKTGDLAINNLISAAKLNGGKATVALESTGNISETGTISADNLSAVANGNVGLAGAGVFNNVSTIAGSAGGPGGFQFNNGTGVIVGSVPLVGPNYQPAPFIQNQSGITATTGPINITANGSIAINSAISAPGNEVVLIANSGDITQANFTSSITAAKLAASAPNGSVLLPNNPSNNVNVIAGSAQSEFAFVNSNSLEVGTVGAFQGIRMTNPSTGVVALSTANGNITQTNTITAGSLSLGAVGSISLQLNNNISTLAGNSGGSFSFTNSGSFNAGKVTSTIGDQAGIFVDGQTITLTSNSGNIGTSDGAIITGLGSSLLDLHTVLGVGSLTAPLNTYTRNLSATNTGSGGIYIATTLPPAAAAIPLTISGITNSNGDVLVSNAGTLTVNGTMNATQGNIGLDASGDIAINSAVNANTPGSIVALKSGGNITQSAAITSSNLSAVAAGNVTLTNSGNSVANVAGRASGANGFAFNNSKGFSVGTVLAVGPTAPSPLSFPGVSGINTTTGPISLTANGDLTVADLISANNKNINMTALGGGSILSGGNGISTSGTLTLSAGNNIGANNNALQTSVSNLAVTGANNVFINNTGANANNLNVNGITANNEVALNTSGSLVIQAPGITSASGGISLTANNGITLNRTITAQAAGNTISLITGSGDITQSLPGYVVAGKLIASAPNGSVILGNPVSGLGANNVGTIAGSALNEFTLLNAGTINIGSVGTFAGISTSNTGIVALRSMNGNITQSEMIKSGSLGLIASGDIALPLENEIASTIGTQSGGVNGLVFTNKGSFTVGDANTPSGKMGAAGIITNGNPVKLTSTQGSINTHQRSINGSNLNITAFSGIGALATPLNTVVDNLVALNGNGGGDIVIANAGKPITIGGIAQTQSGNIKVSAPDGTLNVDGGIITPLGNVELVSRDNLTINNSIVANAVNGVGGNVALESLAGNIIQNSAPAATITANSLSAVANGTTAGTGTVSLGNLGNAITTVAGRAGGAEGFTFANSIGFTVGTVPGVGPLAVNGINSNGEINLVALTGNMTVDAPITATNANDNIISIETPNGSILQGTAANTSVNTPGLLILTAGNDIGPLQIDVRTLLIPQANNVFINNTSPVLNIMQINANKTIDLSTDNLLNVVGQGVTSAAGDIALKSKGDMYLAAPITTSSANIVALESSGGNIFEDAETPNAIISAGSLSLKANALISLLNNNNIVGANGPGVLAGTNFDNFSFVNGPSFNVGQIAGVGGVGPQSGITSGGPIALTSNQGSIGSNGAFVVGPRVDFTALSGVGSQAAPMLTQVSEVFVSNGTSNAGGGDVAIDNAEIPLTINGIVQNNSGSIFVSNTRSISVAGDIKTGNGDIGLRANNGSITIASPISATGANNIVALETTNGDISQVAPAPITASRLSASAINGNVDLSDVSNSVSIVAGRAGGSRGFTFINNKGFSVGTVPLVGPGYGGGFFIPALAGITTTQGPITISANSGNLNLNGNINAGSNNISIATPGGSILQGLVADSNNNGTITTTGTLTLSAGGNIGTNTGPGFIQTNVGTLSVPKANDVFINNIGTDNLNILQILGDGVVNVGTKGPLTIPPGNGTTNFTGLSITLIAGGTFRIGDGNIFTANNGAGTINLYAGFDPVPGSSPVSNGSNSDLIQGGVFNGGSINLFANSFDNFKGNAIYSTPPHFSPGPPAPPVSPTVLPDSVIAAANKYIVGLNIDKNFLLSLDGVKNEIAEISCSN